MGPCKHRSRRRNPFGAAFFSGLLSGRKQLPVELRPAALDGLLAQREIDLLSPEDRLVPPDEREISVRMDRPDVTVSLGDVELLVRPVPGISLADQLRNADLEHDIDMRNTAIAICRQAGWVECVETVVQVSATDFRVIAQDGLQIRVAGFAETEIALIKDRFRERLEKDGLPEGAS